MTKSAAGLVIFRCIDSSIQYLLMKASYSPYHWSPPKGHVDPGESNWETALRETTEEAGIKEEDLVIYKDICRTLQYTVKKKNKTVYYWLAELKNPNQEIVLSKEHTEFVWLNLTSAQERAGYPDFNAMLADLEPHIIEKAAAL